MIVHFNVDVIVVTRDDWICEACKIIRWKLIDFKIFMRCFISFQFGNDFMGFTGWGDVRALLYSLSGWWFSFGGCL